MRDRRAAWHLTTSALGSLGVRGAGMVLRLGAGVLLARLLGATDYGIYGYAVTWLGLLAAFSTFGLDQVLLRDVAALHSRGGAGIRETFRRAAKLSLAAATAVSLIALATLLLLAGIEGAFVLTMAVTLLLIPVVVAANLRTGALRALNRPLAAQLPENVVYPASLCAFALACLVLHVSPGVVVVALANAGSWLVAAIIGGFSARSAIVRESLPGAPDASHWRSAVPVLTATTVATFVLARGDIVVLGALRSAEEVGMYTAAARAAEVSRFMYEAVGFAVASMFAAAHARGSKADLQSLLSFANRLIFVFSLPLSAGLFAFAPEILGVFGPEFIGGVLAFRIMVVLFFLSTLGGDLVVLLNMGGHHRPVAVAMAGASGLTVLLSLLLVPPLGMNGAAIAMGGSLVALKLSLGVVAYKRLGVIALPFWRSSRTAP